MKVSNVESFRLGIKLVICTMLIESFFVSCVTQDEEDFLNLVYLEEQIVKKIPLADPYILVEDDMYYAYGTLGANSGFYVYVSSDLISWQQYSDYALSAIDVIGDSRFWAPEVYKFGDKYNMFYSANDMIAVASAVSPLGPFINSSQRWLTNQNSIDGNVLKDTKDAYLYFVNQSGVGNRIYVVKIDNEEGTKVDDSTYTLCLFPSQEWELDNVNEGPTVVKIGKKYLMTYSAGTFFNTSYGVGIAVADDPMGPWEKYDGNPILQYPSYKGTVLEGTGHNSLFKDLDGNWRMVFHAHSAKGIEGGRYMYIVSVDLLDHPPYIVFHDDLFAPVLAEEDATDGSAGTK